jgi:hypothetical protein
VRPATYIESSRLVPAVMGVLAVAPCGHGTSRSTGAGLIADCSRRAARPFSIARSSVSSTTTRSSAAVVLDADVLSLHLRRQVGVEDGP